MSGASTSSFARTTSIVVAGLALLPLGFILWIAAGIGWRQVADLVFRARTADLLVATLSLELLAVPPSIVLGVSLAWLVERSRMPGRATWGLVAVAPLAIPAFVQGYAWATWLPGWQGLPAAVTLSVLSYYPFVFLPVTAQLRRLDPALEEAAASLGRTPWQVFVGTTLPQLRPALLGGGLLVALHLLGEYGLYALIGFETFTTAIVDQFQSASDSVSANMLGAVLVLLSGGLLAGETALRGGGRYARVGAGAARLAAPAGLGAWRWPAVALPAAVALAALGVPLLTLGRWLAFGGAAIWTDAVLSTFAQTVCFALAGGLAATLLAAPMAWLSVREPGRLARWLEACHFYVGSLPGIVVALALTAVAVRFARPLYQTYVTIFLAYGLIFLPRALVGLRASLAQVPVELERAARALGRPPARAVLEVTLRLAAPGIAAAMALVGLGVTTELTATLLLAPIGSRTLATEFWSWSSELDYARSAPYAATMIAVSLPLTLLLHAQSRRLAGR